MVQTSPIDPVTLGTIVTVLVVVAVVACVVPAQRAARLELADAAPERAVGAAERDEDGRVLLQEGVALLGRGSRRAAMGARLDFPASP